MYSPEFFRDDGYIVVGKIDTPRRTEHKGSNIEVKTKFSSETPITTYYDSEFNTSDYGLMKPIDGFNSETSMIGDNLLTSVNTLADNQPFRYEPETYDFPSPQDPLTSVIKNAERFNESKNGTMKAIASIGVISAGLYAVLRSVGKRR